MSSAQDSHGAAPEERRLHHRACPLCEAICGLEIETIGGTVASIRGDKNDPLSRGHICPKAVALKDIHEDPDRLRQPLRKTSGGAWEEIGWDEALSLAATGIRAVQARHGEASVAAFLGNPNVHNLGAMLFNKEVLRAIGSRRVFTATSTDQLPHHFASTFMLGHSQLLPVPDIDRTDFMLMLGANPSASNGSLMTAPGVDERLKALAARGGKLVLIDPRRTETARLAAEHHFIRPGSDVFLLAAMLNHILTNDLGRPGRMAALAQGWDELRAALAPASLERAEAETGVAAAEIRRLAEAFAAAERAVVYGRMGVSVQAHGGLCKWLIYALNIATGNFDAPGGAMLADPAVPNVGAKPTTHAFARWRSMVRGLPEFDGQLPVAALAEEIEDAPADGAGDVGPIRGLVTFAGNPVLSTPNGGRLDRAFGQLEFMVSIDIYLNETTRHADLILPPATGLEASHYDIAFHNLAVRNTAKYSPAVFEIGPEQKRDYEILQLLAARLKGRNDATIVTPEQALAMALAAGPYAPDKLEDPSLAVTFERLLAEPSGVDLGPLRPGLPEKLRTEDGKIALAPALFTEALGAVLAAAPQSREADRFELIGRRQVRDDNSWLHNSRRLVKGKSRCTAMLNVDDAARLGVGEGDLVRVSSRVGAITLPAEISDGLAPGVVCIPHGYGHGREGVRLSVAQELAPGVSVNDLTDEQAIDPLTGNAAFSGQSVQVERAPAQAAE
ncbi:MAG: molybdopterin-dependent oxidoreductase [Pseudomonadota bacterium]